MSVPQVPQGYTTVGPRRSGRIPADGTCAGRETNWSYQATDPSGSTCSILYCQPGIYTIVDTDRLDDISGAGVWSIMNNGYPGVHVRDGDGVDTMMLLHAFLLGPGSCDSSSAVIEHINRDRLDNRMANLRVINHSVQNYHRLKCRRQHDARPLPDGLIQSDLPKYVVYHKDKIYKPGSEGKYRDYFRVSGHPLQVAKEWTREGNGKFYGPEYEAVTCFWSSTKSKFKTAREKLADAIAYVTLLDVIAEQTGFDAEEELYNGK